MLETLHTIGYYLAAALTVTLPAAMLYWYLIHPFAAFWRRLGKGAAFTIVGAVCLGFAVWLWRYTDSWLAVHWGYHWALITVGLALYGLAAYGEQVIRRQLRFRILVGTPELDPGAPGALMTDGVFGRSRNPRYVNIVVAMLGWAMILNYPALYIVVLLTVPALWLVVLLEERELRERFGQDYVEYCRNVPRFIPRKGWLF